MNGQKQSTHLAKNVSAVLFTRPMALIVTRIGTSSNFHKYPSMMQQRGFRSMVNSKPVKRTNIFNQKYGSNYRTGKKWQLQDQYNYSLQMRLALRGYYL
mmetsp:Transcript_25384/g.40385  ORF Transcript_25384/g.40385 Transcript_25384/m.40385 type:complete len:99 (-) Transcript_25384:382-678(-)